jgi:hypothetical protein
VGIGLDHRSVHWANVPGHLDAHPIGDIHKSLNHHGWLDRRNQTVIEA